MSRITSRPQRERPASPMDSAFARCLTSPLFRPFMYGGFGLVGFTVVVSKVFGIDRGMVAVVAGVLGIVGFAAHAIRTSVTARRASEEKRAEFYDQITDPREKGARDGR